MGIDARYFYRIRGKAYTPSHISTEITGLAVFDKRVILFGSEGNAKVFSSESDLPGVFSCPQFSNMPKAVIEAVAPIILDLKLVDTCCRDCCEIDITSVPAFITDCFGENISFDNTSRRVFVSFGQFSILRLERDSQLLIDITCAEKRGPGSTFPGKMEEIRFAQV